MRSPGSSDGVPTPEPVTPRLAPAASTTHSLIASPLSPLSRAQSPALPPANLSLEDSLADDAFSTRPMLQTATRPSQTSRIAPSSQDPEITHPGHHSTTGPEPNGPGKVLVISGGSGYNDLVGATPDACFVMPISDNGGSSAECIRVLGGPSIGDLRSRLVRLIPLNITRPDAPSPAEASFLYPSPSNHALHRLLSYRLPSTGRTRDVKMEWLDILEGRHPLWNGIESERKECIRGFLVHFESEVLHRANRNFNFRGGSIGNFFLAAAQKFFRSLQTAVFLFSIIAQINVTQSGARVIPVINTNHTATIAAQLDNADIIVGQCEISHPARPPSPLYDASAARTPGTPSSAIFDPLSEVGSDLSNAINQDLLEPPSGARPHGYTAGSTNSRGNEARYMSNGRTTVGNCDDGLDPDDEHEEPGYTQASQDRTEMEDKDASSKHTEDPMSARMGNIIFNKQNKETPLPARISRVFYVNAYRNEVYPAPNPEFIARLNECQTLVYSCGSLWTSIIPCLVLRGVASTIAHSQSLKFKVLLLNTQFDRESNGYTALDFVDVITKSLNRSDVPPESFPQGLTDETSSSSSYAAHSFITHIVYYPEGQIKVDITALEQLGIRCIPICRPSLSNGETRENVTLFDEQAVRDALNDITL